MSEIRDLTDEILRFRDARDWAQFHTPRNLAAALSIEAAELQEAMLWKTEDEVGDSVQDGAFKEKLEEEIGDVLIFALLLSESVGVTPSEAIKKKLKRNEEKYPVDLAKGNAAKYDQLGKGN